LKVVLTLLSVLIFLFLGGCVSLRGYLSQNRGRVVLRVKKPFGEGYLKKDYYLTQQGTFINLNDNKERVIRALGLPDKVTHSLEGYYIWIYKSERLKVYFQGDYVRGLKRF